MEKAKAQKKRLPRWIKVLMITTASLLGLMIALLIILFISFVVIAAPDIDATRAECIGQTEIQIPYKDLADEKTQPFVAFGSPLTPESYDFKNYQKSIERFPEVKSCLTQSEQQKAMPDITRFDWRKINNDHDAKVCLFRVFSSIGDPKNADSWLKTQGIHTSYGVTQEPEPAPKGLTPEEWFEWADTPDKDQRFLSSVVGSWSTKVCGAKYWSNPLQKKITETLTWGFSVGVEFTQGGKVWNVNLTHTVL